MIRRRRYVTESDNEQKYAFTAIYSDITGEETEDWFNIYATSDMKDIWQTALNYALKRCPQGCCVQELCLDKNRFIYW